MNEYTIYFAHKRLHLITLLAIAVPFLAPASAGAAESSPFADQAQTAVASSLSQMPYSQLLRVAANGDVKSVQLDGSMPRPS
jgi:hypothetical protein